MDPIQHTVSFVTVALKTFPPILHRSQHNSLIGPGAHIAVPLWTCGTKPHNRPVQKPRLHSPIPRIQQELNRGLNLFRDDMVRFQKRLRRWTQRGEDKVDDNEDDGQAVGGYNEAAFVPIEKDEELPDEESESPPEEPQAYRPRSVTGQAVAEGFSTLRGTVTRALDVTFLNVREAIRTAGNVLMSVAVKFVPALPVADEGRVSSGWRLLASLQWQSPPELLERKDELQNSVRNVISKARLQRLNFVKNRAKQDSILRVLGSSATSAGSLFSGVREAVIGMTKLYGGRPNVGIGKRIGGQKIRARPDRKPLTGSSPDRKPLTGSSPDRKPLTGPSPDRKPLTGSSPDREPLTGSSPDRKPLTRSSPDCKSLVRSSPALEPKFIEAPLYKPPKMVGLEEVVSVVKKERIGKKSAVLVAAGAITAVGGLIGGGLTLGTIVTCTAIVATSTVAVAGRIDSITPPSRRNRRVYVNPLDEKQKQKNHAPRSKSQLPLTSPMQNYVLKKNEKAWTTEERLEIENDGMGVDESLETTAYSVGPAKPWLVSVPLFGDGLKMLDSVAYVVERGWRSLLRALGIPMKNSRVEGGWVILDTLQRNRYTDYSGN